MMKLTLGKSLLNLSGNVCLQLQGRSPRGARGACFLSSKVQQFQFQTSGILLFTGLYKVYGAEISQFLPCRLQILDNLQWLFIFSNYIVEINHFTLDKSDRYLTPDLPRSFILWSIQRKTTMNESLNVRLKVESWTC